MRILITGTPGTGKTTLAKALAKALHCPFLDVKALIRKKKIYHVNQGEREKTVNLRKLKEAVDEWFYDHPDGIAESHLLCEFPTLAEIAVVLRCHPDELRRRLSARKYPKKKTGDNVLCEALDYCTQRMEQNISGPIRLNVDGKTYLRPKWPRILEIDTTRKLSAKAFCRKVTQEKGDAVNWSAWLEKNV